MKFKYLIPKKEKIRLANHLIKKGKVHVKNGKIKDVEKFKDLMKQYITYYELISEASRENNSLKDVLLRLLLDEPPGARIVRELAKIGWLKIEKEKIKTTFNVKKEELDDYTNEDPRGFWDDTKPETIKVPDMIPVVGALKRLDGVDREYLEYLVAIKPPNKEFAILRAAARHMLRKGHDKSPMEEYYRRLQGKDEKYLRMIVSTDPVDEDGRYLRMAAEKILKDGGRP